MDSQVSCSRWLKRFNTKIIGKSRKNWHMHKMHVRPSSGWLVEMNSCQWEMQEIYHFVYARDPVDCDDNVQKHDFQDWVITCGARSRARSPYSLHRLYVYTTKPGAGIFAYKLLANCSRQPYGIVKANMPTIASHTFESRQMTANEKWIYVMINSTHQLQYAYWQQKVSCRTRSHDIFCSTKNVLSQNDHQTHTYTLDGRFAVGGSVFVATKHENTKQSFTFIFSHSFFIRQTFHCVGLFVYSSFVSGF